MARHRESCIVRDGVTTWHDDGVMVHYVGVISDSDMYSIARDLRVPVRITWPRNQAQFAHDVAMERFGLRRGHSGLWFVASVGVAAWARY